MLIDAQVTESFSTLENLTLFMNSVTANLDSADNISVSPKSLQVTYNSIAHPGIFSILIILSFLSWSLPEALSSGSAGEEGKEVSMRQKKH